VQRRSHRPAADAGCVQQSDAHPDPRSERQAQRVFWGGLRGESRRQPPQVRATASDFGGQFKAPWGLSSPMNRASTSTGVLRFPATCPSHSPVLVAGQMGEYLSWRVSVGSDLNPDKRITVDSKPDESPMPSIVTIARRRLVDFYRRKAGGPVPVGDWSEQPVSVGSQWTSGTEARLVSALEQVPAYLACARVYGACRPGRPAWVVWRIDPSASAICRVASRR